MILKKTIIIILVYCFFFSVAAEAFWIWTPKSKKLVNPKYAVKDSPQQQYDWAMTFYKEGDYRRAAEEFLRMVSNYKNSDLAPDAQYYSAISYQKAGMPYKAFINFQAVIEKYPFTKRIAEIVKAEYELGEIFYHKHSGKLMGMELMTDVEKAIEIFKKIIENSPYSEYADNAQFMMGMCHKKLMQYNEAVESFQKLTQEYPTSDLVERANYEVAQCMYISSLKADYDQEITDDAMGEFKKYAVQTRDKGLRDEADQTIALLKERKAESLFNSAEFYEKRKKYKSARIYYNRILNNYPTTSFASLAKIRVEYISVILESERGRKK
ncbi:MAG: outer membrane protein assembly factor BamD [Candidatus Omnitrophica bacterium]|nr:outer membrane protein assembly factor BamD [Candidatus Omnitrophota bacterium]